jgi:transcriptional regulator with XRE-family HTH domain
MGTIRSVPTKGKPSDLGRRLKGWREKRALSQEALAAKAGVHRQVIARLETGKRQGANDDTVALARSYRQWGR